MPGHRGELLPGDGPPHPDGGELAQTSRPPGPQQCSKRGLGSGPRFTTAIFASFAARSRSSSWRLIHDACAPSAHSPCQKGSSRLVAENPGVVLAQRSRPKGTVLMPGGASSAGTLPTSSTLLGSEVVMAGGADADPIREELLEVGQQGVEGQGCPSAFGLVRRSQVRKTWAAVAKVAWWCQPVQLRPSKWSSPTPVFSSR